MTQELLQPLDVKRAALTALACAAVFLVAASAHLDRPGIFVDEAFQGAEAALAFGLGPTAAAPRELPTVGGRAHYLGPLPWMTAPYVGAVKTYLLGAVFAVFGIGPLVLRATTVLLGASVVFLSAWLAAVLYGSAAAWLLGLWLASDPALVIMARHDPGPGMVSLALKMAGLCLFFSGLERGRLRRLFAAGLCFGAAFWDKTIFLWFLAALPAAWALALPRPAWAHRDRWIALGAGVLAGASPLILYNLVLPLQTFASQPDLRPERMAGFFAAFPDKAAALWDNCRMFFDGRGYYSFITGVMSVEPASRVALVGGAALAAPVLAFFLWVYRPRTGAAARHASFWALLFAFCYAAAALTPMHVHFQHMPVLYPFPQLAFVCLLTGIAALPGTRPWKHAVFAAFAGAALLGNLTVLRDFHRDLAKTGGAPFWYRGLEDVARVCRDAGGPVLAGHMIYAAPVLIYTGGAVVARDLSAESEKAASSSGALLVLLEGPRGLIPDDDPGLLAGREAVARLSRKKGALELVARIPYSDGRPWTAVYRVHAGPSP